MPELPDLEVFKTNVFDRLTSKKLAGLEVFNQNKVPAPKEYLMDNLAGRELLRIDRVGKELMFDFGDNRVIAVHLMLNGQIFILPEDAVGTVKFKIFSLQFANETVVFSDRGSLCTVKYMPPANNKAPDAFDSAFTKEYFLNTARKKARVNIKALLIDQYVVKGIGNAYADEILWDARISPHSVTGMIPEDRLAALYQSIHSVLRAAVASIQKISPDRISGEERSFLKVHNKNLKETETGRPIIVETVASKITYHTDEQILYS